MDNKMLPVATTSTANVEIPASTADAAPMSSQSPTQSSSTMPSYPPSYRASPEYVSSVETNRSPTPMLESVPSDW